MTVHLEEWFSPQSCTRLAELGRKVTHVDGLIVEIGSWTGRSTCALAAAVTPRQVHAVDHWNGSPGELSAELAADRDVYAEFVANTEQFPNVIAHRVGWRDYLPTVTEPVALCFIDAEHSYDEVADNIRAVLPLLAQGGIICGDDAHHPPVKQAVLDVLGADYSYAIASMWVWQKPAGWRARLANMYRRLCVAPSDINEHLPVMADLVKQLDAQHVIELGTRSGVSTVAWLHALAATGGRLTSVDIDTMPPIGEWPHWTFVQADDTNPELIASLEPADIVFIDTSHRFQHTLDELNLYLPLVKPGGVIVLHDTELETPTDFPGDTNYPVMRAVQAFTDEHVLEWVNLPNCWGLAIIKIGGE